MAAKRAAATTGQGGVLRVRWARSEIGHNAGARGTIRALGLHRMQDTVEIPDTPVNRGMIRRVAFLLDVEETSAKQPKATESKTAASKTAASKATETAQPPEEGHEAS